MIRRPIGIFDSGIGGLTVLNRLLEAMPGENFVYFGDTARLPYGSKSKDAIVHYSQQNARFLLSRKVKMIIVACNSASSNALTSLKRNFDVPVFGVIEPAIRGIKKGFGKIGLIGTYATVESGAYQSLIIRSFPGIKIFPRACPLFVPFVEEGMANSNIALEVIRYYLEPMKRKNIDALILACTHYPVLAKKLGSYFGKSTALIDPAAELAREIKVFVRERGISNPSGGKIDFFLSDIPRNFGALAGHFLKREIGRIKKIDIERY